MRYTWKIIWNLSRRISVGFYFVKQKELASLTSFLKNGIGDGEGEGV